MSDRWPGIKRAALEIAYDNGGINRDRSEKTMLKECDNFLDSHPEEMLQPIDKWLSELSEDDLSTVCAGEESDAKALLETAPPFTEFLLNAYFDEVC